MGWAHKHPRGRMQPVGPDLTQRTEGARSGVMLLWLVSVAKGGALTGLRRTGDRW